MYTEVVEMSGWRPIETAPKDGRYILAYRESAAGIFIAKWCSDKGFWINTCTGWHDLHTHWMPLPEPPEEEKESL